MRAVLLIAIGCGSGQVAPAAPNTHGPASTAAPADDPPQAEVTQTPAPAKPIDDSAARDASKQFITVLRDSKGAIGRCHEAAVGRNAALEDRTVSLAVAADFAVDGTMAKLSLSPFLDDAFEACVQAIAAGWKLTLTQKMSFKASIELTP